MSRLLAAAVAAVVATALLVGCSVNNLDFRADKRVKILAPRQRHTVTLPFVVSWSATQIPAGDRFGVFVDDAPIKPGQALTSRVDSTCRQTPGCANAAYLANLGIYVTAAHQVTITSLTTPSGTRDHKESHGIDIVIISPQGTRVGEAQYEVDFFYRRQAS